jgi:hypothetical protein
LFDSTSRGGKAAKVGVLLLTITFYRQQKALAATSTRCAAFRAIFGR